jgi:hypothetical protein
VDDKIHHHNLQHLKQYLILFEKQPDLGKVGVPDAFKEFIPERASEEQLAKRV